MFLYVGYFSELHRYEIFNFLQIPQSFLNFNIRAQGSFLKMHKFCTQVSVIFNYNYTVQKDRIF